MTKSCKKFLRRIQIFVIGIPFLFLTECKQNINENNKAVKPNIVLFVADDAGWHDVGYHGSEINTPNIDKLAETGVELNQFYVCPTCSPTRASLLTGQYASRFEIYGPIAMRSEKTLPEDVVTLPGTLREAGYATAITGKWHLGLQPEHGPLNYGFDYAYGYLHGQIDQYTHRYKNGDRSWHRNDVFIEEEGHATDLITKEAINYITDIRDKEKPFFIYIPYSAPHYPLQEEEKWIEPYKDIEDVDSRKLFDAAMAHMDFAIGEVLKTLEDEKLLDNTLIIFISDNGGQESWDYGTGYNPELYDGRNGPYPKLGTNIPLKGYKEGVYEGGIRVPAIFNWQGKLTHRKIEQLTKVTDLFPTIISLVDSSLITNLNLDGKNVWGEVIGKQEGNSNRGLYERTPGQFAIRKGDWKLIHFGKALDEGREELYNISEDPYETKNIINDNMSARNDLFDELQNQVKSDQIHN